MNQLRSVFFFLAVSIGIVFIMIEGQIVLIPLSFGILLAILFHPFIKSLKKRVKYHGLAFLITILGFLLLLILPVYFIVRTLMNIFSTDDQGKSANIQDAIDEFTQNLSNDILLKFMDRNQVQTLVSDAYNYLQDMMGFVIMDGVSAITNIVLALLFSYFLHAYFSETRKIIIKKSDPEEKRRLKNLLNRIPVVMRAYVQGIVFVIGIISVFTSLLLLAIGLEYALVWGLIVGMFTIIPYVGSALGIMFPMFYSLIQNQSLSELAIIAGGYFIIQFIEGNFVTPKVVGDKVGVNPFIIIIGMMAMGKIWGVAGVMITIPLMAAMKIILEEYGHEFISKVLLEPRNGI